MKHAVIVSAEDIGFAGKHIEVESEDGKRIRLAEKEYSAEEMEEYYSQESEWIFCRRGEHMFLADSDSGEDAKGYYGNYFELLPEKAVFQNGKMTGIYLCSDGINYSGRGRYNYDIDAWGIPGYDPFSFIPTGRKTIVLLFDDDRNCRSGQFMVLRRIPGKEYKEYLEF